MELNELVTAVSVFPNENIQEITFTFPFFVKNCRSSLIDVRAFR